MYRCGRVFTGSWHVQEGRNDEEYELATVLVLRVRVTFRLQNLVRDTSVLSAVDICYNWHEHFTAIHP